MTNHCAGCPECVVLFDETGYHGSVPDSHSETCKGCSHKLILALAMAEEIIYKALAEVEAEKAEDYLIEAYRALGRARREIRRAQEAEQ